MTRPKGCEHLTDEQIEQLNKVGRATGSLDLVEKVCAKGAADTSGLEAAGINFKDRKPQTFAQQFLAAATPTATKDVPVTPKPTLPAKIQGALAAANAGGPDMRGFGAQVSIGRKANEKPADVGDRNEALAQAVAKELGPQVQAIRDFITGVDGVRQSIAAQLTDIDHRLSNIEESQSVKAMFPWDLGLPARPIFRHDIDLSPGGNSHRAGTPFPWNRVSDFWGRVQ